MIVAPDYKTSFEAGLAKTKDMEKTINIIISLQEKTQWNVCAKEYPEVTESGYLIYDVLGKVVERLSALLGSYTIQSIVYEYEKSLLYHYLQTKNMTLSEANLMIRRMKLKELDEKTKEMLTYPGGRYAGQFVLLYKAFGVLQEHLNYMVYNLQEENIMKAYKALNPDVPDKLIEEAFNDIWRIDKNGRRTTLTCNMQALFIWFGCADR